VTARLRLDVSHDPIDSAAKRGRRQSAAELQAATARRQAIEQAQVASVAALTTSPPRVAAGLAAVETSRGGGPTSQQTASTAPGVRGGGASVVGTSPTTPVPSRPALTIPPGAAQWRHVPAGGWVLSGEEKAAVERLLAAEATRMETEE
jgi:hypothetical protein